MSVDLTFGDLHRQTVEALLSLLDGFHENLEYAVLELAERQDEAVGSRYVVFLQALRKHRDALSEEFAHRVASDVRWWTDEPDEPLEPVHESLEAEAKSLAGRAGHFSPAIDAVVQRTATATGRPPVAVQIPIAPQRLAYHFLTACTQLQPDPALTTMLGELFGRFVLDGLGPIYGCCNSQLEKAGFGLVDPPPPPDVVTADATEDTEVHVAA